jgi:autotransporter translocation and assembly factor TamB
MSKVIKIVGILVFVLIVLIASIFVIAQTDYFRNTIKSVVEKSISSASGQNFKIGKIEGDFIHSISIKDVSFQIEGKPFMHLDEFSVKYSLLSILDPYVILSKVLPIENISFSGLSVNLERDENGNLNINKIGGTGGKKGEGKSEPPNWNIFLKNLLITNAKITIEERGKKESSEIEIQDMDLSIKMLGITRKIDLNLKKADMHTSPQQFNIKGLSAKVLYTENKVQVKDFNGDINGTKVKFDGEVNNFIEPKFNFKADASGFKIEKGVLNTEVQGSGQYKSPEDIHAEIRINLPDSQIMGKKINVSIEKIKIDGVNLEVQNGVIKTEFGEAVFRGNAKLDYLLKKGGANKVDLKLSLKDINLSKIPEIAKNQTDIGITNADLYINGRWKEIDDLEAKVNINKFQQKGKLGEINLKGVVEATKSTATLSLVSDLFKLKASGSLKEGKRMDFTYDADVNSLKFVSKLSPDLDLKGSLKAVGRVQGEVKSPRVTLFATVSNFGYKKDLQVKSINLSAETMGSFENPQFRLKGKLKEIKVQERSVQSIDLRASSEGKGPSGNLFILENPQRSYEIQLKLADLKSREKNFELQKVKLNLANRTLQNRDVIDLTVSQERLIVKSFNLFYGNNSILCDANVGFNGDMNAALDLRNINLTDISQILGLKPPIEGIVSGDINLRGTTEEPNIRASLNAANLRSMEFRSDKTTLNLSYLNKKLNLDLNATENGRQILLTSGRADMDLNFKKIGENLKDATFDFTIRSPGIDLSPLAHLNKEIKEIHGKIVVDLRASGNTKSPKVNGQVKLQDVSLKTQSLKDEIKATTGLIEMQGEKGILRTLEIQTDGGRGSLQGYFDLRRLSYNLSGKMDSFQINLKEIEAKLDGDVRVKGSEGKSYVDGNIKITSARIRIPEEPAKQVEDIKFVDQKQEKKPEQFVINEVKQADYFRDNIGMNLNISIPGNAWVKGKGANIEVKGKLGVIKKYGEPIIVTGIVNTVRGTYEIFGKLFKVEESTVSFPGTPEINPFLDVKTLYRVSNVKIFVNVTGTGNKPVIKLSSEPPMDQTDIISYLAFGMSSDKIGAGQRVPLQQKAQQIIGSMAAGKLKDVVGEKFQLDVATVTGGEKGLGSSQIEAGKYITDKIYIGYERSSDDTVSTPYSSTSQNLTNKARIEYRPYNFLTLESTVGGDNQGGDVFFNFDY